MAKPSQPIALDALKTRSHLMGRQDMILRQIGIAAAIGVSPEKTGPIAEITAAFRAAQRISKTAGRMMIGPLSPDPGARAG